MAQKNTLIFDGDDTLWKTHFLYEEAKTQAAELLNNRGLEIDRDTYARKVNMLSVEFGKRHGFINTRFPTALTEAYEHFCQEYQVDPDEGTLERLWSIGASVATTPPKRTRHARNVLETLSRKYDCILYTLGDEEQQLFRLNSVSLAPYFKRVFAVLHKNETALMRIMSELILSPSSTWMIGNSAKSDIEPALNLGLHCIWFHSKHWLFDDAQIDTSNVHEIWSLNEIGPIIETWEQTARGN